MSFQSQSVWRIKLVLSLFILLALAIIAFLLRWQIFNNEKFKILAQQRIQSTDFAALRGPILASDGSPLAYSVPVYDVYAAKNEIEEGEEYGYQTRDDFVKNISEILSIKYEDLYDKIHTDGYILIAKEISVEQKERIESLLVPKGTYQGLHFENKEKRIYPDGKLASHVLGFVGKSDDGENIGRNGIEGYWEGDLAWKKGFLYEERDVFGNQILTSSEFEPIRPKIGRTVKLTINRGVQKIIEQKIEDGVKTFGAEAGTIVVMDPKTGAVVGMANYPNYDPNKYWEQTDGGVFMNKSVSFPYEIGSVGKCLTASAGIDSGAVQPDTVLFESREGCVEIADKEICVADRKPAGSKTVTQVLVTSDNIGAYYIAKAVGAEKMYDYFVKFGIGMNTNVGLGEENTSLLKNGSNWNKVDLATYAYGQGYSATPIQVISAISAIPNHGKRMQPYIVSEVQDQDKIITIDPRVLNAVMTNESSEITNDMLVTTFEKNGSKIMFPEITKYRLAGKTGTAQVLDISGTKYAEDKTNTTFIGWDASEGRKFIMVVKLENPTSASEALFTAQPLWVETFLAIKDYLGVVPIVGE